MLLMRCVDAGSLHPRGPTPDGASSLPHGYAVSKHLRGYKAGAVVFGGSGQSGGKSTDLVAGRRGITFSSADL